MASAEDKVPSALQLNPDQDHAVQSALQKWVDTSMISKDLAEQLLSAIEVNEKDNGFDWHKFSKYAFRLSIVCVILTTFTLLDSARNVPIPPAPIRCVLTAAIAIVVHVWAFYRQSQIPNQTYRNEAIHGLGVVMFALYAMQVAEALNVTDIPETYKTGGVLSSLVVIYGVLAYFSRSNFVLSCTLAVSDLFIVYSVSRRLDLLSSFSPADMDSIWFLAIYGVILVAVAYLMRRSPWTNKLWATTRMWGLLHAFIGLSVLHFIYSRNRVYSIGLVSFATFSTWHGLRFGDATTKGFGLTFICLDLFLRFIRGFHNETNEPVLFGILALVLGVLGRYGETMWNYVMARRVNQGRIMLV